ncbi:hypothetical protein HOE07_05035 [archaeon]|nr:hypothetical protein [archaeon]
MSHHEIVALFMTSIDVVVDKVVGTSRTGPTCTIYVSGHDSVKKVTFEGFYPTIRRDQKIRVDLFLADFSYPEKDAEIVIDPEGREREVAIIWSCRDLKPSEKAYTISLLDRYGQVVSGPYHSSVDFR